MIFTEDIIKKFKIIGTAVGAVLLMYTLIALFTIRKKLIEPEYLKKNIKELEIQNAKLVQEQKKIDSISTIYNKRIDSLNDKLNILRDRTIAVKQYYHDKVQESERYDSSDLDKFFKDRYNF